MKETDLQKITTENDRLENQKRSLKHKIDDLKQILRMVSAQGDDRISEVRLRNAALEDKAETLRRSLTIQRKFGARFDQISGFWQD